MKNDEDDVFISAFVFNTAREMERIINERTDDILKENKNLMGLIFEFRNKILLNGGLSDFSILRKFDDHFQIVETR